jgi:hypothetical protein
MEGNLGWFGKTVLAVIGIGIVGAIVDDKPRQSSSSNFTTASIGSTPCADQKACDEANRIAYDPRRFLKPELVSWQWGKGGFDSVMLLKNVRIKNGRPDDIKDLIISCTVSGASGTDLQSLRTVLYDIVPAGRTKTFREINMGFVHSQAAGASCDVDAT